MPEVQEVFRLSTQKVRPDPGALERQVARQQRRSVGKKIGAFAVAAVIGLAAIALFLVTRPGDSSTVPGHESPSLAPVTPSGPYILELTSGEMTPLPEGLAGGFSYVATRDGTQVVYGDNSGGGCGESSETTVANIDGTDAHVLPTPKGLIICGARWSPDGASLVYQLRDGASPDDVGNLFVRDLSSGRTTQLTDLGLTKAWWWYLSPSFSPDGRNVFFHLPRNSTETTKWDVWSVRVAGGELTLRVRDATFPILTPAPGPDGRQMAFVQPTSSSFGGQSLMSGRPAPDSDLRSTMVEANVEILWPTMSPDGQRVAYQDGGSIYVTEFGGRGPTKVATGQTAEWLGAHTLIIAQ
jgi:dipeptidyl aminopeptidase/acylaminoacyl peptidase